MAVREITREGPRYGSGLLWPNEKDQRAFERSGLSLREWLKEVKRKLRVSIRRGSRR